MPCTRTRTSRTVTSRPRTTQRIASNSDPVDPVLLARAESLCRMNLEFIVDPAFSHPEVAETLERGMQSDYVVQTLQQGRGNPGDPQSSLTVSTKNLYLDRLADVPLLSKRDEECLFSTMNFLKFRANQLRQKLKPSRPDPRKVQEIEELLDRSVAVRNYIIRANLRLVVALAKKFAQGQLTVEELISEGHLPLMRSVELFDYTRGYRFSTYATWAVRNHCVRLLTESRRREQRSISIEPDLLPETEDDSPAAEEQERRREFQQATVKELLSQLSDREQMVMAARFGLAEYGREHSLAEIGRSMSISKERVRQLALRSIQKLKEIVANSSEDML